MIGCAFCDLLGQDENASRVVAQNAHAAGILDGFPVSDGHSLVIPRRHVLSIFELNSAELDDVWSLVAELRDRLRATSAIVPDGFNIGPNDGTEAGQTVAHAHVHVIPRYRGDVPDPKGGIRWVIPRKANYWKPEEADPFQQVEFLQFIQSLLEHGEFVSTYKFALLQALADLSLESDSEVDGTLKIRLSSIAEKIISYYWHQAAPFHDGSGEAKVLRQYTGPKNAAIVSRIAEVRLRHSNLFTARASRVEWRSLVSAVGTQVKLMPLFKLQTVGRRQVETLYANAVVDGGIVLKKGIQDCFRRFYGIVVRLCRRGWLDMARKLNPSAVGASVDLEQFLFGSERAQWPGIRSVLREIQERKCFYCSKEMRESQEDLDHFIPWSLYPNDLAHNFVLACRPCNSAKSDELAGQTALGRWIERNCLYGEKLEAAAKMIGLPADANASAHITAWAYEREKTL